MLLAVAACSRAASRHRVPGDPVVFRVGVAQPAGAPDSRSRRRAGRPIACFMPRSSTQPRWLDSAGAGRPAGTPRPTADTGASLSVRDLTFDDGSPLDADAVATVLDRRVAAESEHSRAPRHHVRAGRERTSISTIEQRVHSSLLLEALAHAMDHRWPERRGGSAGPYRVVSRQPGRIVLEAFDGYYLGRPEIDRVELLGYPVAAGGVGGADARRDRLPLRRPARRRPSSSKPAPTSRRSRFCAPYVHLLGFNVAHPSLADVRVRRAISVAIDRQAIITQAFGGAGCSGVRRGLAAPLGARPVDRRIRRATSRGARALLAEALGTADRARAGRRAAPRGCRASCPRGYPAFERSALVLQRQLLDVGVDLRPEVVPVGRAHRTARDRPLRDLSLRTGDGPGSELARTGSGTHRTNPSRGSAPATSPPTQRS